MKMHHSSLWNQTKKAHAQAIRVAIIETLRKKGPMGYNRLHDEIHAKYGTGKNQFNAAIKAAVRHGDVHKQGSPFHKRGVSLSVA